MAKIPQVTPTPAPTPDTATATGTPPVWSGRVQVRQQMLAEVEEGLVPSYRQAAALAAKAHELGLTLVGVPTTGGQWAPSDWDWGACAPPDDQARSLAWSEAKKGGEPSEGTVRVAGLRIALARKGLTLDSPRWGELLSGGTRKAHAALVAAGLLAAPVPAKVAPAARVGGATLSREDVAALVAAVGPEEAGPALRAMGLPIARLGEAGLDAEGHRALVRAYFKQ